MEEIREAFSSAGKASCQARVCIKMNTNRAWKAQSCIALVLKFSTVQKEPSWLSLHYNREDMYQKEKKCPNNPTLWLLNITRALQKTIGWPLSITKKAITLPRKNIRRKLMTIPSQPTNIPIWRIKRAAAVRNHKIRLAWRALVVAVLERKARCKYRAYFSTL